METSGIEIIAVFVIAVLLVGCAVLHSRQLRSPPSLPYKLSAPEAP